MRRVLMAVVVSLVFVLGILVGLRLQWPTVSAQGTVAAGNTLVDIRNQVPVSLTLRIPGIDDAVMAPVVFEYGFTLSMRSSEVATDTVQLIDAQRAASVKTPPASSNTVFVMDGVRYQLVQAVDHGKVFDYLGQIRDDPDRTQATFIVAEIDAKNNGNEPASLYDMMDEIFLLDRDGRTFEPFDLRYQWDDSCAYVDLNPGIAKTCYVVFEVPNDVTDWQMQIGTHRTAIAVEQGN